MAKLEENKDFEKDVERAIPGITFINDAESVSNIGFEPIVPQNAPAVLSWHDLVVSTKASKSKVKKQLLNNLSGSITGGLWAIMGSSGSGKTTFLSTLALRIDTNRINVSGETSLNGENYSKRLLKGMSGYVMQDDLVHAHLTVAETLAYTAELRMPSTTTPQERAEREEYVMKLMGITHCRDVIVGDTRTKGISGGERKRLCIAIELLTRPKLLFLDEPTSGLDSANALAVIKALKQLTESGECTVVTTIHQPQSKIYALFDNLILMSKGDIVYQGLASRAVDYFASVGFPCPPLTNPADHLIDVLVDQHAPDASTHDTSLNGKKLTVPFDPDFGGTMPTFALKEVMPWYRQWYILMRRNLQLHLRRWDVIAMNIFVTMLVATFTCMSVWRTIGTHKNSGALRMPALFFCVIHQGIVSSLQGSHSFPLERSLMLRERAAGTYYVSAYFLAKTIADMLFQLLGPIIFTLIVYPIIGFRPTVNQFFIFMSFMGACSAAATSLATMISCLFVSIEMSTVVLAAAYEICRLYGGWFISPRQISSYNNWQFADALSYIKYTFVGVALNENSNLIVNCLPSDLIGGKCSIPPIGALPGISYSGHDLNGYYGFSRYTIQFCGGILAVYIVICRLIAYIGLRFIKV